jgi:hypothetical protein
VANWSISKETIEARHNMFYKVYILDIEHICWLVSCLVAAAIRRAIPERDAELDEMP